MNYKWILLSTAFGMLHLSAVGSARSSAPPELEAEFDPLPTRIEQSRKGTVVLMGDRSYRLEPVAHGSGSRIRIVGKIIRRKVTRRGQWERVSQTYGDDVVTVLPGFGLAMSSEVSRKDEVQKIHYLLRGVDGAVNPPIPSKYDEEHPFVFRANVGSDGFTADRTLIVVGPRDDYKYSGSGAAKTATLLDSQAAFAWLFDSEGLTQAWTGLRDMGGGWHGLYDSLSRSRYVVQSEDGRLIFATAGENNTLTVHSLDPDLKQHRTIAGVRVIHQQTEKPSSDHVTVNSIGAHVFENTGIYPGRFTTVLLAPVAGQEDWYGKLEADGSLTLPEGAAGVQPLARERRFLSPVSGVLPEGLHASLRLSGRL